MTDKPYRSFRCKAKCGLSIHWQISRMKDGKWKATSAGSMKSGRNPFPSALAPFEIVSAVENGPRFDTDHECEAYIRSL